MRPIETDAAAGLRVTATDTVVTVTLDRPERRNCQDPLLWDELVRVKRALAGTVRVAVLRGAGTSFSAGLDRALLRPGAGDGIAGLADLAPDAADTRIASWQRAFDWSGDAALVSVAAVHGHAVGAGFQLALGADIRIAADDAQFCMPEPTLGIVPDLGGTRRLVELVGPSRATEICLTGRRVDADEALRIGLVSAVVPRAELDTRTDTLVATLLAVDRGAAAETKALLRAATARTQAEQEAAERAAQYRRLRDLRELDDRSPGSGGGD